MKKLILHTVFLMSITFITSFELGAQILNSGFEEWGDDSLVTTKVWNTSNSNHRKIKGLSGWAIEYDNKLSNGMIVKAKSTQASYSSVYGYGPAFAWTYVCDSLRITYKCNLGTDEATIKAGLNKKDDWNPAFLAVAYITGTQNTWKTITVPFEDMHLPDSVPSGAWVTIEPHNDNNNTEGSFSIDKIEFVKNGVTLPANIPDGDFENWISVVSRIPKGWFTSDDFLTRETTIPISGSSIETSDAYSGVKALRFAKYTVANLDMNCEAASFKEPRTMYGDKPAFKINQRYSSFRGYYKSSVSNYDRFIAEATVFYKGNLVGTGTFQDLSSKSSYTLFSADIKYSSGFSGIPDSAFIYVALANKNYEPPVGTNSWVHLDDLSFSEYGANTNNINSSVFKTFPNPASDRIVVRFETVLNLPAHYAVIDLTGKTLLSNTVVSNETEIDLSSLARGCYFIQINYNGKIYQEKITLIK